MSGRMGIPRLFGRAIAYGIDGTRALHTYLPLVGRGIAYGL